MREDEKELLTLLSQIDDAPIYFYQAKQDPSLTNNLEECFKDGYLTVETHHFKELSIFAERQRCYVLSRKGRAELNRLKQMEEISVQELSKMRNTTPKIFISHANEDNAIAKVFYDKLSAEIQPNPIQIFLSSANGIKCGDNPLNSIQQAAVSFDVMVSFLTPCSIQKPWILFEAGAAWGRKMKIIPLYFGGLTPQDLPRPIQCYFQAKDATKNGELAQAIASLGESIKIHIGMDSSELSKVFREYKVEQKKANDLALKSSSSAELSDERFVNIFSELGKGTRLVLAKLYAMKTDPVYIGEYDAYANKLATNGLIKQSQYGDIGNYELPKHIFHLIENNNEIKQSLIKIERESKQIGSII